MGRFIARRTDEVFINRNILPNGRMSVSNENSTAMKTINAYSTFKAAVLAASAEHLMIVRKLGWFLVGNNFEIKQALRNGNINYETI